MSKHYVKLLRVKAEAGKWVNELFCTHVIDQPFTQFVVIQGLKRFDIGQVDSSCIINQLLKVSLIGCWVGNVPPIWEADGGINNAEFGGSNRFEV